MTDSETQLINPSMVFDEYDQFTKERTTLLALDMAYETDTNVNIAAAYGLTVDQLVNFVKTNGFFRQTFAEFRKAKTSGAEHVMLEQAKVAVSDLIPHMSRNIKGGLMSDSAAASVFGTLVKLATNDTKQGASGLSVNFNFTPHPGLTRVPQGVVIENKT